MAARARAIDLVDEVKSGCAGSPEGERTGAGVGRRNKTERTKPHNKTPAPGEGKPGPAEGCVC